jgi:GNAT superfamily N-acetyltransferase
MPNIARYESRAITKADYDHIVRVIDCWWEGPIAILAHPVFFYELGEHARVVEEIRGDGGEREIVGFLLGFISKNAQIHGDAGYVHIVGIHPKHRRHGVGRALYADFIETCRRAGCVRMKAITTPGNVGSLKFHEAIGWATVEEPDYAGPGRRRLVMTLDL